VKRDDLERAKAARKAAGEAETKMKAEAKSEGKE
jgi:hypothetical protein